MKNFEKYKEELRSSRLGDEFYDALYDVVKDSNENVDEIKDLFDWLFQEAKTELTTLEYEILIRLYKIGYRYLLRKDNGRLIALEEHPKERISNAVGMIEDMVLFYDDFKFVKFEDKSICEIEKVLDNCKIVDSKINVKEWREGFDD